MVKDLLLLLCVFSNVLHLSVQKGTQRTFSLEAGHLADGFYITRLVADNKINH